MPSKARTYNAIHVLYKDDLAKQNLSKDAKSIEMYLMLTSPNIIGIWHEAPETIARFFNMEVSEVKEALSELEFHGRITIDPSADWIFVVAKWKFDPYFKHPTDKHIKGIYNILETVPSKMKAAFLTYFDLPGLNDTKLISEIIDKCVDDGQNVPLRNRDEYWSPSK